MACRLYNTERCLQLQLFNRPNFGVHFRGLSPCAILLLNNLVFCNILFTFVEN